MEKDIDAQIIKATQTSLGKYVKRPPLSEKLLKKPPFRFLHDIITTILKTTGFFEGLFEKDELISENVKDRDSKIVFLNKVITIINYTSGKNINIKASKIVAGQEAEKTNELLQCLAQALDNNLSSAEAVKKFKENGLKPVSNIKEGKVKESVKKKSNTKTVNPKSTDNISNAKKEVKDKLPIKKEIVENNKHEKNVKNGSHNKIIQSKLGPKKKLIETKPKSTEEYLEKTKIESTSSNIEKLEVEDTAQKEETWGKVNDKAEELEQNINDSVNKAQVTPDQSNTSYTLNENDLNSSSSSHNLIGEHANDVSCDFNSKISNINENPSSLDIHYSTTNSAKVNVIQLEKLGIESKYDTNRTESKHEPDTYNEESEHLKSKSDNLSVKTVVSPTRSVIQRPISVRPSSSRPGAPRLRDKLENVIPENENIIVGRVNIIAENDRNNEEDDNSIIVAEHNDNSAIQDIPGDLHSSNDHGHLVQQIMESQKELNKFSGKTEIEWECGVQKAKETQHQEIEQLKYNIQALSRVANPLGKLLDHVQEDVEVMRQELQQWTNIYNEVTKEMQKQKLSNEDSFVPLRVKLKQLDREITEKQDKVDDLKVSIYKNSTRIEKLLAGGNVQ